MTETQRAAIRRVLEACEQRLPLVWQAAIIDELNNLRAALAEPQQSPNDVGYVPLSADGRRVFIDGVGEVPLAEPEPEPVAWRVRLLYTTPPARRSELEQEPVAVRWRWPGYRWTYDDYEPDCFYAPRVEVQRLYTTPPARRPLTHPQIHELDWPDDVAFEDILEFARAIERAHGIGGNDE